MFEREVGIMEHGQYVNPGNSGFQVMLNSEYVDKTGLIGQMNSRIDSSEGLVCVSRPRRFGKSYAAKMLCAYYDSSCDSRALFDGREISRMDGYEDHMNKYNVVCFDVTSFLSDIAQRHGDLGRVTEMIPCAIKKDLVALYPYLDSEASLTDCLLQCADQEEKKFIFIIDEWDAVIREAVPEVQKAYLNLLRGWFKNISFTPKVVAAAYLTGILPIKKDGSQSAISDFIEYPILYPDGFAEYTGFTAREVQELCAEHRLDFESFRTWYDGYDFPDCGSIYNPYSVMRAVRDKKCRSYWQRTSASESLFTYINMDFDGLQEVIARLIAGEDIEVDVDGFENDFQRFKSRDDILTLLIHLGYLTYHEDEKTVRIPNEEIRIEFHKILKGIDASAKWIELIQRSKQLIEDTIAGKSGKVAEAISAVRDTQYAPTFYNDEQSLRYVVKFAYVAAVDQYMKVEELPSGHGIADIAYIPKKRSPLPALVVELKWNKSAGGAIGQIKAQNYPAVIKEYEGDVVLVGINYDPETKAYTCEIERLPV